MKSNFETTKSTIFTLMMLHRDSLGDAGCGMYNYNMFQEIPGLCVDNKGGCIVQCYLDEESCFYGNVYVIALNGEDIATSYSYTWKDLSEEDRALITDSVIKTLGQEPLYTKKHWEVELYVKIPVKVASDNARDARIEAINMLDDTTIKVTKDNLVVLSEREVI